MGLCLCPVESVDCMNENKKIVKEHVQWGIQTVDTEKNKKEVKTWSLHGDVHILTAWESP